MTTADDFFAALGDRDLDRAFAAVSPAATVLIHPIAAGGGPEVARAFFEQALAAFSDLALTVTRSTACGNGTVLVELTFEGTQAADFLGAVNQEKHLDIEQAWLLAQGTQGTQEDGLITAITGYWDQNKLYRRLAVKRLDRVAIA